MNNKSKAIILMLISSLSFSLMGAMIKLSGDISLSQKIFFRNLVSLFLAFYMVKKEKTLFFGKKESQQLLLARSLLGLGGIFFYFYAINNLVLADSSMLNKLSPFFVMIFASIFLKEKITKYKILSLIFVFIGTLLVIKPGFSMKLLPAISGFFSAFFAGAAYTIVRHLKNYEKPATIVFYFSFISVIGSFPIMIFNYTNPNLIQWSALIFTGIFAAIGQFSLTYSYRLAPASEVAIFNYTNIVFSGIIGFLIWREIPDKISILGYLIIIGIAIKLYLISKNK